MSPDSDETAASMTCPACGHAMHLYDRLRIQVAQCEGCRGIFLARASLADLIETENDWHVSSAPHTQPLPRITSDMEMPPSAPPATTPRPARSFVDALFG